MSTAKLVLLAGVLALVFLLPGPAAAQGSTSTPSNAHDDARHPWFVLGGASTTLLGDCTGCESNPYIHSASVTANAGMSITRRADLGAEILWTPQTLGTGDRTRITFLTAAVQVRPWVSRGFFLKGNLGMAFLRNWLDTVDEDAPPIRSKAFALGIGAGWEWRLRSRFGAQIFGSQHAAALGDLETSERTVENVMGNFWSVGAAIVIR